MPIYCIIASQMWTLGRLLPVMIGHIIPEDNAHWVHYLEVLDIMDLFFHQLCIQKHQAT